MKKFVVVMVVMALLCTFLPVGSVFAAEDTISVADVKIDVTGEEGEKTPDGELKDDASKEEGMLQISASTLLKLKLKLENEGTPKENVDMAFVAGQDLTGSSIEDSKIQFIDQQTTGEDGTISIRFRPRPSDPVGIYSMRVGAEGAGSFSKFYKTLTDQIQPVLSKNPNPTVSGSEITLTVTGYSEAWDDANELYIIGENDEKTKIENYSFEPDSQNTNIATLKIMATGALKEPATYTLRFVPKTTGGAYNPITFTATVSEAEYSVTLDADGGSAVTVDPFKKSELTSGKITIPDSEKNGYDLDGWYTEKTGGVKVEEINSENVDSIFTGGAKTVTLYARWTPVNYSITYHNVDDAVNPSENKTSYTIETETFNLSDPTRVGYTFEGWYSDSGCTKAATSVPKGSTENKDFYAKWTEKKLAVSKSIVSSTGKNLDAKNVSVESEIQEGATAEVTVTAPSGYTVASVEFVKEGETTGTACALENGKYTFTMPSTAVTVKVTVTPITYTINFDSQGGTGADPQKTGTVESLPTLSAAPTRTGFNFAGWYTLAEGGTKIDGFEDADELLNVFGSNTTVTLYAHWTEHGKFMVDYSAPKADPETVPEDSKKYDAETDKVVSIAQGEPTRSGYTFAGWKVDGDETVYKYGTANDTYTVTSSDITTLTFRAQWTAATYTITLNPQGGEGVAATISGTVEVLPTLPAAITKAGYTFDGWYTAADGGDKVEEITAKNLITLTTLHAHWTEIFVQTVTVTPASGSVTALNGTVQFAASVTPQNAADTSIEWSITDVNGNAVDDTKVTFADGLFTAIAEADNDEYIVTATNARSGKSDTARVTVNINLGDPYSINSVDAQNNIVNVTKRGNESAFLIVALYKDSGGMSVLVKASITDISDMNGTNNIELNGVFDDEYDTARVFMWNNLDDMAPMCDGVSK